VILHRYVAKNASMAISTNNPNSRPVIRWLNHLTCPFLVITAAVMAFPQLIGSKDEPAYSLAIAFLALAVVLGIAPYARESENRRSKEEELVRAATEFAAGNITLEEYGTQTKKILDDP
jgi:uncharacterized membrane protein